MLYKEETLGLVRTRLPGEHNVLNVLAALAVSNYLGVDFKIARDVLSDFHGADRRFQIVGEAAGVIVIDDYAHHPSEIKATLSAARQRFPDLPAAPSRVDDAADVVQGLGGQADHEVELHVIPLAAEDPARTFEDVLLADVLVDRPSKTLSSCLRRQREARLPDPADLGSQPLAEARRAQRRQRERYLVARQIVHQDLDQGCDVVILP